MGTLELSARISESLHCEAFVREVVTGVEIEQKKRTKCGLCNARVAATEYFTYVSFIGVPSIPIRLRTLSLSILFGLTLLSVQCTCFTRVVSLGITSILPRICGKDIFKSFQIW